MGLIRLAGATSYCGTVTSGSHAGLGTASSLGPRLRIRGNGFLNAPAGTASFVTVSNSAFSTFRLRLRWANDGTTVSLYLYTGTTLAASCTIAAASIGTDTWYRIRSHVDSGGCHIGLYADDGTTELASGTGAGASVANSNAANGYVLIGVPVGGAACDIDALGFDDAPLSDVDEPTTSDPNLIWYVPITEAEVGTTNAANAVGGGTAIDTFSGASIVTGGSWNGAAGSVALTGTAGDGATEAEIVAGGGTLVLTLTGDTWVTSGATFDAQRQNIIDGIDSAQAEANGWDAERTNIAVTAVVRTSDTVVTITLPALGSYAIAANETVTCTVPATALTGAAQLVASPTFTISATVSGSPWYYYAQQY